MSVLGRPRLHFRLTDSTNARARELARRGAPHGTLVTAGSQSAGRGRQGRTWSAPPGRALLCSVVIRDPPRLLPLVAGVAVAEVVAGVCGDGGPGVAVAGAFGGGGAAVSTDVSAGVTADVRAGVSAAALEVRIKWPNDVLLDGRKVAGILVEGRPQEGWAVVGIGVNVALRVPEDLPDDLRGRAGTLGLAPEAVEPVLDALLERLERWLGADGGVMLDAVRALDFLRGRSVRWLGGEGVGAGIDAEGRLMVATAGGTVALDAGEVHLMS